MRSIQSTAIVFLVVASLSACGGGSGSSSDSSSPPPPTSQSPGGIWTVQYTEGSGPNTGDTIQGKALVTETGDFFYGGINTANGCAEIGFGTLAVKGSSVSGTANTSVVTFSTVPGVNASCSYQDGTTSGRAMLTGTLTQRSSLDLTSSTTTSAGMALASETHTWAYSSLYAEMPSLANVAGNYADGSDTLTIGADGSIFEQDPASGCVVNGQVSIVNPAYNAYAFSYTFESCTGVATALNGQTATGLGYLDDSVSPNELVYGVHLSVAGQIIAVAGELPRM